MSERTETLDLFPAVVRTCNLNNQTLHARLREKILETRMVEVKGLSKSNVGGWHSPRLEGEVIELLEEAVLGKAAEYARHLDWDLEQYRLALSDEGFWAIINGRGAANALHIHQNAQLSGVYYVDTPPVCGDLIFEAPRPPHTGREPFLSRQTLRNTRRLAVLPQEETLVLFPSWLPHRVEANQSNLERIAVSFNITMIPAVVTP
jgi:uncharacterized protein (TIGR02466 family)